MTNQSKSVKELLMESIVEVTPEELLNGLQCEYEAHRVFIEALLTDEKLCERIKKTKDNKYLQFLNEVYFSVNEKNSINCEVDEISENVQALKNSKRGWIGMMSEEAIGQVKFHKRPYRYRFPEKTLKDVTIEGIKAVKEKYMKDKDIYYLVKDNGRTIIVFGKKELYENYNLGLKYQNRIESIRDTYGDDWTQSDVEQVFTWNDEHGSYEFVVAEYKTEAKLSQEEQEYNDGLYRFYFNIEEDTGNYRYPTDVYRDNELF
ncbi:hypothetical protein BACERE00183_04107 [Bacillus cereus]|nr:hypothetical protein BACERE00183_04107 [Bacillus cereus]